MRFTLIRGFITLSIFGVVSNLFAQTKEAKSLQFEPGSSAFQATLAVSILSEHPVHFTLDGSDPGLDSKRYTAPIQLTSGARIRARAILPDGEEFPIVEGNYLYLDSSLEAFSSPLPILVTHITGINARKVSRC